MHYCWSTASVELNILAENCNSKFACIQYVILRRPRYRNSRQISKVLGFRNHRDAMEMFCAEFVLT